MTARVESFCVTYDTESDGYRMELNGVRSGLLFNIVLVYDEDGDAFHLDGRRRKTGLSKVIPGQPHLSFVYND